MELDPTQASSIQPENVAQPEDGDNVPDQPDDDVNVPEVEPEPDNSVSALIVDNEEVINEQEDVVTELELINNEVGEQYVAEADAEAIEQGIQNEDDRAALGPLAGPILRKLTFIRRCTDACPELDLQIANDLYQFLLQFATLPAVSIT